jgi:glycerophosphoryl diester phosphodiesterase
MRFGYALKLVGCALVFSLVVLSCTKKDRFESVSLIAHAGAGLHSSTSPYHDNTVQSIEYALHFSVIQGVEVDVQLSADGTAWLFHDEELSEETNGEGCLNSKSDSYLEGLHYQTVEQEHLSKLSDVPALFSGKKLFLDVRDYNACTEASIGKSTILAALSKVNNQFPNATIAVITNRSEWMDDFHQLGWDVFLNVYSLSNFYAYPNSGNADGICVRSSNISEKEVAQIKSMGKQIILFDVRSPKGIRKAFKKEPNLLFADDIRAALIEKYR